jgi:hypothetical protein
MTREEIAFLEQEGNSMALLVENNTENKRAYIHYLKTHDQTIVRAVFLYTIQQQILRQQARRPITYPGKYFTSMLKCWGTWDSYAEACLAYWQAKQKDTSGNLPGIPEDIQALITRYDGWSLEKIALDLRQSYSVQGKTSSKPRTTSSVTHFGPPRANNPMEPPSPTITEEEANLLREQVIAEVRKKGYTLQTEVAMVQDRWAVRVIANIGPLLQPLSLFNPLTWEKELHKFLEHFDIYTVYLRNKQRRLSDEGK